MRTGATAVGGRRPAAHRELPSAHGGHEIEARAAHYRGALAHNPSHHAPQSPLIRARTRYVEFGPSHPHVGLLFRAWATPPACGIGGSLSSAHGGHGSRRKATSCPSGATECAWGPRDRGACSPLPGRARTQPLSPCASIPFDTRANTLCGVWAFSSARGPAIPSLGNPARVRNRGFTCGTGGPRADPGGVVFYNPVAGTRRWIQKCGADAFIGPAFPREEDRKIRRGRPWRGRRGSR